MNAFLDFHFDVMMFVYPVANLITLGFLLFGIARTPLKRAFGILSVATALLLVDQILNLMYFLKTSLNLDILSVSTVRTLFPVQACMEYVALALHIVGAIVLVFGVETANLGEQCLETQPEPEWPPEKCGGDKCNLEKKKSGNLGG